MHPTVTRFLNHLRVERNASAHTLRSYEDDLSLFCRYLEDNRGEGADPAQADARRLQVLLKETPVDLKGARAVHDSLARFAEGLAKFKPALNLERLDTMREGFRGMQTSLATGAEQVERLGGFTYPVVAMNGLKPEVTQRPFWPEAGSVADINPPRNAVGATSKSASNGATPKTKPATRPGTTTPKTATPKPATPPTTPVPF